VLDQSQWVGWETSLRLYYHSEGVKTGWWPHRRGAYSPEFQSYLARTSAPEQGIGTLDDLFENVSPTVRI
jgi:hypothetical protein